jgi:ElaB/YqjD/DUF883 family membrane-anchored ribosome-binding protein
MKNNPDSVAPPEELLTQLHALVSEAEALMSGAHPGQSGEMLTNLRERFGVAQERLADLYDGAKQKVVAGAKYTDTAIRENPYQSLAIALGVGVFVGALTGFLIGRRRS